MILVDTTIWVDHFRVGDPMLAVLLDEERVLVHPFVIGELAVGNLRQRELTLHRLRRLLHATVATHDEVLRFVGQQRLFGLGIGYVDCHLLASARLTLGASVWTRDRRLLAAATQLGLAAGFRDRSNGASP